MSPGDIVKIKENSTAVEFMVLIHNYPSSGRTLLLRKLCKQRRNMHAYNGIIDYDGCSMDVFLNGDYFDMIDPAISSKISAVPIEYTSRSEGFPVKTIQRKVFLLSSPEVGFSNNNKGEGTAIPYFNSNDRRIAYYTDSEYGTNPESWWTRSIYIHNSGTTIMGCACVNKTGILSYRSGSLSPTYFARPAFTLPSNTVVDSSGNIVA